MEQNTQSSENNAEIKLDQEGELISPKPEKKINMKIILLIIIFLIIVGVGAVYFLFLNKNDDDGRSFPEENVEVEVNKEFDSDQDGLPDYLEKILGTDENNSDTDGDSYSDFEEIKNGYNPLTDEKFTEEEWEEIKERIRGEDEGFYNRMYITEEKKIINFSQLIEGCKDIENESFNSPCINSACDLIMSKEEKIRNCLNADSDVYKDLCLMMIMPRTVEVCDNLSGDLHKDTCYSEVVGQTKDILMCEKISSDIDIKIDCYKNLALAKNDSEICQKIDYNYFKEWCMTDSKKDFSICSSFEEEAFDWDEVAFNTRKNTCLGAVTGNVDYCNKINEENTRSSCYRDVAVKKNYLLICNEIESNNDYYKDECYMRIAIKREDDSLCDLLGDEFREQCHNQISIKRADFSFCKEFSEIEQFLCYYSSMLSALNYFDINQDKGVSFCEVTE